MEERSEDTKQSLIWNIPAVLQLSAARKANCSTNAKPPDFTEKEGAELGAFYPLAFVFFILYMWIYVMTMILYICFSLNADQSH